MKFSALFVALAACASLYGGTGVTQRMMERYVGDATGDVVRVVGEQVRSVGEQVETVQSNLQGVANRVQGLEESTVPYTEYAAGISNLVDFVVYDADVQEPAFNSNGTITISHIDTSTGYPRRIPIVLRVQYGSVYATNTGFCVTSSSWGGVDEGQLFACTATNEYYNSAFGSLSYEKVEDEVEGETMRYYRLYGTRGGLVFDSSDAYENRVVQVFVYNGTADMSHLLGSFTVVPYNISDSEFNDVASGRGRATTEWGGLATERVVGIEYWWEQISPAPTPVALAPERKRGFSLFDLFFPSAYAAPPSHGGTPSTPPTVYFTQISGLPMAEKYDWEKLYPNHEKDEFWEPRMWYLESDWNNPYNWIVFPVTVNIPYEYGGETFTMSKTVHSVDQLAKYFIVAVPPSSYQEPQLKKKKDYCKAGQHIYVNCVCTRCGYERPHSYDPVDPYDYNCAVCNNRNTSVKRDVHGDWVPDTDSGARCTHVCDEPIVSYHAGWHHEGSSATPENAYACSCKCGTFSPHKNLLGHHYSDPEAIVSWHDAGDGHTHYGVVKCTRGRCRHEDTVFRDHEIIMDIDEETGEPTNYYPYDGQYHVAYGTCKDCGAEVEGMYEPHQPVGVGAGESWTDAMGEEHVLNVAFCYCKVCWASTLDEQFAGMHDYAAEVCNDTPWAIYCQRCGHIHGRYEHDFIAQDRPLSEGLEGEHLCYCGIEEHRHVIDETSKVCVGGMHWATQTIDDQTYGQWVEVEKSVDDGCNYHISDDDDGGGGSGKKPIPCWTGKGDNGSGESHQPPNKPNPPGDPTTIVNPCRKHTVNIDVGGWTDEWLDEYQIVWSMIRSGSFFVTGVYPFRTQLGIRRFNGNGEYRKESKRISRPAPAWWTF